MDANHQILCLNMIVKNEAPVIARCLASVRPIVDYWVIVDTGSTDGTQDAIRTLLADLPGELHERSWRDFAHNRSEALELARSHGEYVLFVDADEVLEFEPGFKMPALQADSYMLRIADPSFSYTRTQIVRVTLPWRWRGVLHEFLTCADARSSALLEGLRLRVNQDGMRWRDPQTYGRDAEILKAALQTESDPFLQSRYQFYLAQSYRCCGEREEALQAYLKRAELGFWVEEVFISLYHAAQLQEALGRPFDEVKATYLKAADTVPGRAEALHGASRYCRLSKRYSEGYEIAKRARLSGEVPTGLFVEPWIYEYGLLDELALNAYWAGAYQDSLDACERILRERKCPDATRPRIEANAAFARLADSFESQREIRSAFALLRPYRVDGFEKLRIGRPHDGGYILVDDFQGIDTAFSFGIGHDPSWDMDIANRGVTVYQFDHTIDRPPGTDNPRLIFAKRRISGRAELDSESLSSLVALHDKRNSHPNILIKMDVENDEWTIFDATPPEILARFSQIVVEFHLFNDLLNRYWRQTCERVFRKISNLYAVVHVHANNYGKFLNVGNVMIPNVFEVTFVNRSIYSFRDTDELFPGPLDMPNNPTCPDMYLGSFRF